MQTHRLIEKEWRKVINQAFILKEHRAQRQILLKLEIICFFFSPPHLPQFSIYSLGILCLVINTHIEHVRKLSIVLLSPLSLALVLVFISHLNISASSPTFDKPAQMLYFYLFFYFPCLFTPPTAVESKSIFFFYHQFRGAF